MNFRDGAHPLGLVQQKSSSSGNMNLPVVHFLTKLSTGKNTCQASSAFAVRLSMMYAFSPNR